MLESEVFGEILPSAERFGRNESPYRHPIGSRLEILPDRDHAATRVV